jgi:hypothetical protein
MTTLAQQLDHARAEVERLERAAAAATCAEVGQHDMKHMGGRNCGCENGGCSVPVHVCSRCGACDYGENDEAREVRRDCAERFAAFGERGSSCL